MIHEVAHVGGVDHNEDGYLNTVMNASPPTKDQDGWNRLELRRCDEAGLQLVYDLADLGGYYADCFDDIPNAGASGLKTTTYMQASATFVCIGVGVTLSGSLKVQTDATNYGLLSNNVLPDRQLTIQRSEVAPNPIFWTTYTLLDTTGSGTYSLTVSSLTPKTWQYRAVYADEVGLSPSTSAARSVTWSSAC